MGSQYYNVLAAGMIWTAVGALGCGGAKAVEFKDIAGKWCTSGGIEQFDRDNLIAIPASTNERHVYPIVRFRFTGTKVTVVWQDPNGESFTTDFAEFSADGRRMVQLKNEKGPRREFHRC